VLKRISLLFTNVTCTIANITSVLEKMEERQMEDFKFNAAECHFSIPENLRPSVERRLTGTTKWDTQIQSLPVPRKPIHIRTAILILRLYRVVRPKAIGNRCVFEPSCSHYSELAIRENGFAKGLALTISRLLRCRSGSGGIDLPCKKERA